VTRGLDPSIEGLAAIGDGRTVGFVGQDGTIHWLPVPYVDSPSVFGTILDGERGGCLRLAPTEPFEVRRRYLPATNVLEMTFVTDRGEARVTDALTLPLGGGLIPFRELVRKVEGVSGAVPFDWSVEPRFGYGLRPTEISERSRVPVATAGGDALAVCCWGTGASHVGTGRVSGSFTTSIGSNSLIALSIAHQEPLVFPSRAEADRRLELTTASWSKWASALRIEGPWAEHVLRSALTLKLLIQAPTGAITASPTTSLPEEIGGERNWDYRFCWVRDSALIMAALLDVGCREEAEAYFWWLMHASQLTHRRLQVLYRLDGGASAPERILPLAGYRGSRPVRIGNRAVEQLQLDIYGDVVQTAWLYAGAGGRIDPEFGERVAAIADLVCELWPQPDSGIWEVRSEPLHFTHSKMMCWVALDRAVRLSEAGHIPAVHRDRWQSQAGAIEGFIEQRCWSERKGSYTRSAESEELDSSVLLGIVFGYGDRSSRRHTDTIDVIRGELGHGPLLFRYLGADGLAGAEGAFLCCSFWLVESLAMVGRRDEAAALMDEALAFGNDVGLFPEEIDPATSAFLGNFPQGLTHLSMISAASALVRKERSS
jgi:GH15 family glucan-1,4-alpha-glucosidase